MNAHNISAAIAAGLDAIPRFRLRGFDATGITGMI
jgi:hypothetical protein